MTKESFSRGCPLHTDSSLGKAPASVRAILYTKTTDTSEVVHPLRYCTRGLLACTIVDCSPWCAAAFSVLSSVDIFPCVIAPSCHPALRDEDLLLAQKRLGPRFRDILAPQTWSGICETKTSSKRLHHQPRCIPHLC